MNTVEKFTELLPREARDKLYIKTFKKGEFILEVEDKLMILIVEGAAKGIRYEEGSETFFPMLFKGGNVIGFNLRRLRMSNDWEVVAESEEVKAYVFKEEFIERYISDDINLFKLVLEATHKTIELIYRGFYIHSRGGAKAYFAYLIYENAVDGKAYFGKFKDVAKVLNISEQMLYRITKGLIALGYIKKLKKEILIVDSRGLKSIYERYLY